MARWGNCDYRQLQKLRDNLTKLQNADLEKFCGDVSKELAARLLALVIPRTPVGDYSKEITVTVKRDGKHHKKAQAYARALPIKKQGSNYSVEVINPVHYASYVEFGHRTSGGKGWVAGQYFLTLSEQDLRALAPAIIEKKLEALLREVFRGV